MTRTGAAAGHRGYFHEAVYYGSDDELLAVVVPFLLGGVAAGEPTVVALGEPHAALVRAALPAGSAVSYLAGGDTYARPAAAIRAYREMMTGQVAAGAAQIRIVGELPPAVFGATWDWWARYESAVNHAYDEFPLWSMCAYDTRIAPAAVLADVARTHPRTALADGRHLSSPGYVDPTSYLGDAPPAPADPVQRERPLVELIDPTPAEARRAVFAAARGWLPGADVDDLTVAVSETVTNATCHGRSPVRLRLWTAAGRIVVAVTDGGSGPKDPFAGLLPAVNSATGGLGMWITHQLCSHVTMDRAPDAFTVRLTAGNPHHSG